MKKPWLFLILVATSVVSALPSYFVPFVHTDEGIWSFLGRFAFGPELYTLYTDHKPPLLLQLHWLFSLGESSPQSARLLLAAWNGVGAYFLFLSLRHFVTPRGALVASFCVAVANSVVSHGAFSSERLLLPFVFISLWAVYQLRSEAAFFKRAQLSVLIGLSSAALISIKFPAILLSFPSAWLLLFSKGRVVNIGFAVIGFLVLFLGSHLAVGVDWKVLWQEAYLQNFQFVAQDSDVQLPMLWTNAANTSLSLFGYFLPLSLGAILAVFYLRFWKRLNWRDLIAWTGLFMAGLSIVVAGHRYAQNYFVTLLPSLAILTAFAAEKKMLARVFLGLSLATLLIFNVRTTLMIISDRNKNWDSSIEQVIEEIREDTASDDFIWVNHSVFSIYWATGLKPPMKYFIFHHNIDYLDPCRVKVEAIRENLRNPHYADTFNSLQLRKPKVIFWAQRNSNSCTDLIRLDNFPALQSWISTHYRIKWESKLGIYFIRKNEL